MSVREHSFGWSDPEAVLQDAAAMSGLDMWRAIASGALPRPPIGELMDFDITEVDDGRIVFTSQPAEWMLNPIGSVHGGMISTMLDTCVGCAVHTTLPVGAGYTTLELKVNFVRAVRPAMGRLVATGSVIHVGGRIATAEGRLETADGVLCAHATTTCLVMRPPAV
jgi:uncharacterized protein (TIGR00369 family)